MSPQTPNSAPQSHEGKKQAVESSGATGGNPSTAGPGKTDVPSNTPENRIGHINPSAPEDANTTPCTVSEK